MKSKKKTASKGQLAEGVCCKSKNCYQHCQVLRISPSTRYGRFSQLELIDLSNENQARSCPDPNTCIRLLREMHWLTDVSLALMQ